MLGLGVGGGGVGGAFLECGWVAGFGEGGCLFKVEHVDNRRRVKEVMVHNFFW